MARGDATIDGYLSYLRDVRRLSPNTIESYARDLVGLAAFAEKKRQPVEALTLHDLEAFARHLMSAGLSPRSVARAIACTRATTASCCSSSRSAPIPPPICGRLVHGRRCPSISASTRWIGCSPSRTRRRREVCATKP